MLVQKTSKTLDCYFAFDPPACRTSGSCPSENTLGSTTKATAQIKRKQGCTSLIFVSFCVCVCTCRWVWKTAKLSYNVFFSLFISTEQGKVLKVLHTSEGVFIISQYSLFHNEGPVLNMAIDSPKVWCIMLHCMSVECVFSCIPAFTINKT